MALAPVSGEAPIRGRAQAVLDCLNARGALFFDELAEAARLLRPQLEEALGELAALGLAASDSFSGLRALLVPSGQRKPPAGMKRRGRVLSFDIESGGRWALINRTAPRDSGEASREAAVEYAARTLLARYGVVFWRLLTQEPGWLPPWRDLLRVYRRLEARGEIRGGRFVAGFSGEQFALPDAVGLLREIRRRPASGQWVSLSGADPLNLIGILTPGQRLAALTANRVVYRDGLPVAALTGGKAQFLTELETADQWEAEKRLVRSAARGRLADLV
jgi:ATP-dependent Lhr-like helicase